MAAISSLKVKSRAALGFMVQDYKLSSFNILQIFVCRTQFQELMREMEKMDKIADRIGLKF